MNTIEEIWLPINAEQVNPNWIIASFYKVSNKGRIFNMNTGKFIYPNEKTGKVSLVADFTGYCPFSVGSRATFNIKNIMKATFENTWAFGKHYK